MNKDIQHLAVATRQHIDNAKSMLATAKQVQKLLQTGRKWRDVKQVKLKSGQLYIVRRKWEDAGCKHCVTYFKASVDTAVVQLWKADGWYRVEGYGALYSTTASAATIQVLV